VTKSLRLKNSTSEQTTKLAVTNKVMQDDLQERKKLEEELLSAHEELEHRVAERTMQLETNRQELETRNRQLLNAHRQLEISRDRYSHLYDFAPLGYATLDDKGVIREINLTGARLLGTPRALLTGMPFKAFLQTQERRNLLEHLQKVKHSHDPVVTELRIVARGGDTIHAQLSSVPSRDEEGSTLCLTAITDITELKKTEESLLRLNRLYAVLSETGKAIVYSSDRDTLFGEICRVAVEHGGFLLAWIGVVEREAGELVPVASFGETGYLDGLDFSGLSGAEGVGPTGMAIREGGYFICNDFLGDPRTRTWRKRGRRCGFRSSAAVALKLNGEETGVLNIYAAEKDFFRWQFINLLQQIAADISFALDNLDSEERRHHAELALQAETAERIRTMEELREKDRLLLQQSRQAAMGEMIGTIAHQWRQPLNALGLTIQGIGLTHEMGNLSREHLDATITKAMDIIFHMSQTIDDFRNFFKPDKEKSWFRINQVVTNTVSLVEANFREYQIAIEVDTCEEMETRGFPREYAQAFLNILMNARDALLEKESAEPRVKVRARMEEGRSVVTVTDNAGGIKEEIIDNIFDLYFTTKANGLGTGIGLFISKNIIEKNMGGSLTVRNVEDGAEFRIEV
jgi:PAS domain S-box-containing protein